MLIFLKQKILDFLIIANKTMVQMVADSYNDDYSITRAQNSMLQSESCQTTPLF